MAQETSDRSVAEGYRRDLKARHIQMIALGGAIGTGLFYGSASAISLSGPAVLFAYLLGGCMIYLVVRALGELSVEDPVSGAFSYYSYKYWSRRAGFISGWNYWFTYIAVAMSELAAVGTFVNYWFPNIPSWMSALFFLVVITAVNLLGVKVFGEFEYWFAMIKVIAVIGMIVLGVVVIVAGINNNPDLPDPAASHLWSNGGLFPNGISGFLMALVVVAFSFGGTELVGITAGEAKDPRRSIPKAINQVIVRILIFYVCALAVIMMVIPWTQIDGEMSPFVQIFDNVGIQGAAHILNFVVLTAAMSVYNSGLYSNGRMLFTLANQGNAPKFLGKMSNYGQPVRAILTSSAITLIAVGVVFLWPEFAFTYMMSIATIAVVISWGMIVITEYKFRQRLNPEQRKELSYPLPGGTVTTVLCVAFLALIGVLMLFSDSYRIAVYLGLAWIVLLLVAYQITHGKKSNAPLDDDAPELPEHLRAVGSADLAEAATVAATTTTAGDSAEVGAETSSESKPEIEAERAKE